MRLDERQNGYVRRDQSDLPRNREHELHRQKRMQTACPKRTTHWREFAALERYFHRHQVEVSNRFLQQLVPKWNSPDETNAPKRTSVEAE